MTPSDPVLLPGVDTLNHARGQPVSWISQTAPPPSASESDKAQFVPRLTIVLRVPTPAGQELFNNYGPKPNAEFLLGYGFTLPNNPDDTILLKIGGSASTNRFTVGREAKGADALWKELLRAVRPGEEVDVDHVDDYEHLLDASGALQDMVDALLVKLPKMGDARGKESIRPQVATMFEHYVEGALCFRAFF